MKRFTKILCLVMALALLCVGLAFIVSAEDAKQAKIVAMDGTETTYDTFADALAKIKNGDTIVLLDDVTTTGGAFKNAADGYTIDLNGHTLDGSAATVYLFNVQNTTLNIVGNGTIYSPNYKDKGLVLINKDYPESVININGGNKGINIIGEGDNINKVINMYAGTMNISNATFTYGGSKYNSEMFVLQHNSSMNLTNVTTYQTLNYVFTLYDNASVNAKYCDFRSGSYTDMRDGTSTISAGLVMVRNVDYATGTNPAEKVYFTMENCTAVAHTSGNKTGQLINLQNKIVSDVQTGHNSELLFNNCTLVSSWRFIIGTHDKDDAELKHRTTTLTFNNCNISIAKINKDINSAVKADDSFVRGNELVYFNGCYIRKNADSNSTFFDVAQQTDAQKDLPKSVTIGEGTYLHLPIADINKANYKDGVFTGYTNVLKLANDSLKLIDISKTDKDHQTYVGTEAPTYDTLSQMAVDFEASWALVVSTGATTESTKYVYNNLLNDKTNLRGGSYTVGVNKYDNNNYIRFETETTSFSSDPYFPLLGKYYFTETAYTVVELEVMTETVHPGTNIYMNYRYSKLNNGSWGDSNGDSGDAKLYIGYDASTGKNYLQFNRVRIRDYEYDAGEWVNIAIVTKIAANKDADGNLLSYAITTLAYVNGELLGETTSSPVHAVSAERKDFYVNELRYHFDKSNQPANATACFDNVRIKQYGLDYTGAIAGMFGTENAKTLPEGAGFSFYETRPLGNPVASVDGVFYDTVEEAIANANGNTVTLFTDVEEPVMINTPVKIDTQGYNVKFVTGTTVAEGMYYIINNNGNVLEWAKVSGNPTAIATIVHFIDGAGSIGKTIGMYPIGTEIVYRGTGIKEQTVTEDGKIVEFIGWTTTQGSNELYTLGTVTTTGTLNLYPVYKEIGSALYTVTVGENVYAGTTANDLLTDLGKCTKTETTYIKLFGDMVENKLEIIIPEGCTVEFDLNGHMIAAHAKQNTFKTSTNSVIYLYSSVPNGRVFVKNKDIASGNDNNGGTLLHNSGKNAKAYIGAKDGQYGENLFYAGAAVIDTGTDYNETYIDGGYYVRNLVDYSGFFVTRGPNKMEIKNATIVNNSSTNASMNMPGANSVWTIDNCTVVGKSATEQTIVIANVGENSTALITNCEFYNSNTNSKDGVTYGAGNTSSANMTNKLAGYKTVQTDIHKKMTIRYNVFGPQSEFATNGYSYEINEYEIDVATYFVMVEDSYAEPTVDDLMWNLTLHSDFTINVYLPKTYIDNGTIGYVRNSRTGSIKAAEAQTAVIDGVEYLVYAITVNADETDRNIQYRFTFNDELKSTYVVDLTVYKYVQTILNSSAQPQVAKELMMACADYVNEAYKLLKGEENANMAALLADEANAAYKPAANTNYGTAADTTAIADAIASAQMVLDADPHFLFTVQKNFTGTVTVTYKVKGEDVNYTVEVEAVADDAAAVTVAFDKLRMYQLGDSFTITAVGTAGEAAVNASTTYGLGAYILGLEAEDVNADFAKALATFAKAAKAYKYA